MKYLSLYLNPNAIKRLTKRLRTLAQAYKGEKVETDLLEMVKDFKNQEEDYTSNLCEIRRYSLEARELLDSELEIIAKSKKRR